MEFVTGFGDLKVYRLSRQLSWEIFQLTKTFPHEERYSLTDQIRRSSRSVGAQVAEAWARRKYEKHFVSKLTDAHGELLETTHWIEVAKDCCYLSEDQTKHLLTLYAHLEKMLNAMITKSSSFCKSPLP
jgi:four helix bundle protein